MKKNKTRLKPYLYCLCLSILFLIICSKNSMLYQINDWVDANAFFTVGKSMVRGSIPYRDLFEQKGPLLYLIYGIGSLIHYKSFIGVFFLETLSFSVFLYYTYKIITLFFNKEKAYLILPFFTFCIITLNSFSHGGSAEEFSLPFFQISLYYLISYLKTDEMLISKKTVFITGVLAGCIMWIKYTLLGFWFGWMLCIFVVECHYKKYKDAFFHCFIYLLGMMVATLPWLLYFASHNALKDLWNVYFIVNINAYPKNGNLLIKIYKTFYLLYKNIFGNIKTFLGIVVGFILLFLKGDNWGKRGSSFVLLTCFMMTGIFIYIGGTNFHYYPFILSPFIIIGILILLIYLPQKKWNMYIIPSILLNLILTYKTSGNVQMLALQKSDYAQYQFAEIISKSQDQTLLNYGFLDGGFYTVTGYQPQFYYFMKNNISYQKYPEMMDSQKEYVLNKIPHYVITKASIPIEYRHIIEKNYHLIKQKNQKYQTKMITYLLYERN